MSSKIQSSAGAYQLYINGEWIGNQSGKTFPVYDPSTELVMAEVLEATAPDVDRAVKAARKAFDSGPWSKSTPQDRAQVLFKLAAKVRQQLAMLSDVEARNSGKPIVEAEGDIGAVAEVFEYYGGLATKIPGQVNPVSANALSLSLREPIGVAGLIVPWNYPLLMAAWKLAPALAAGCTCVLKPAEQTPLTTLILAGWMEEVGLPPGVVNVIAGFGESCGAQIVQHPLADKIAFTGSTEVGKIIVKSAADTLKRVTLELGGNDPAIVLDDADPAEVATAIFAGAFNNNGQVCSAIKRVYVPESLYDDVVEGLAAHARAIKVGEGTEEGVKLGPINNEPQYERVKELVADALSHGATAVTGGHAMDRPGYFFEPTILTGLSDGTRIVDEEQFGPALPVVPYRDLGDAIDRANATHFGLSGSVWGADTDRAAEVAAQLECGTAWVNTHLALSPQQPFGGFKWSGIGVENGPWGLAEFSEFQVVHRSKAADGLNVNTAMLLS